MSSNANTPVLEPSTTHALPHPSPSPLGSAPPLTALDDIPPLALDVLTDRADKVDALKLVADSIAQQRQRASLVLVFHPLCLAALAAGLAIAYRFAWVARGHDLGLTLTMCSGVAMTYLLAIRYVTSAYIRLAEEFSWSWIVPSSEDGAVSDGDEDTIIGTKFGDEMIGALVLRLEPSPSSSASGASSGSSGGGGKKRNGRHQQNSLKGGRGVIRAWTTKLRYRRRGVGADMLHEAVRVTRERCGRDAEVGFAREHANSTMVLPEMFNKVFRKGEMRAARALEAVLADWDGNRRKK